MPKLFLDLDGFLADFDEAFPRIFAANHRTITEEEMWAFIKARPAFFDELEPMPGALEFWGEVKHHNPIILTAAPKACFDDAARAKRRWVHRHLSPDALVIPTWGGKHKRFYMHAPGDILIDDWEPNITSWNEEGGRGILHTSFDDTRTQLLACDAFQAHRLLSRTARSHT